jgi:hypothetical protein
MDGSSAWGMGQVANNAYHNNKQVAKMSHTDPPPLKII